MWQATTFKVMLSKYQEKDSIDLGDTETMVNTLVKNKYEDLFGEDDSSTYDSGEASNTAPVYAANNLYNVYESDATRKYMTCDTISIEDKFGNTINASVTEMIFSVDANGYKAYPTIETLGEVDGMDELVNIFLNNPIYVNVDKTVVVPDIRSELQNLREKNYIAYYVKDIIDYFLDNNKLVYTQADGELGTMLVAPSWNDMDFVVFGGSISQIYNNPNAYPAANTKAMQFVYFMKTNQIKIDSNGIVVPPLDDLASAVQ
jgi:hypothetical protein